MQYDLFLSEAEMLKEEIAKVKTELGNTRRGLFARHGEMGKMILAMRKEIDELRNFVGYKEHRTEIVELLEYATKTG